MKLFVWILGRNGELLDSHLFFFDRYMDLADYHRLKGRLAKAERLAAIAEAHYRAAPDDTTRRRPRWRAGATAAAEHERGEQNADD